MKPTRILQALPFCILLAACDETAMTDSVSQAAPKPMTLEEQVAAHNAEVANTITRQVTTPCGGTTRQMRKEWNSEPRNQGTRSPQIKAEAKRALPMLTKTAECREKEFNKRAVPRASTLNRLAADAERLKPQAQAAGLTVAQPASFDAEMNEYEQDIGSLVYWIGMAEFLANRKSSVDWDSWSRAFSNAAANLNRQYASGTSSLNRYSSPPSTYSTAVRNSYTQSTANARAAAAATSGSPTMTATQRPATGSADTGEKLCSIDGSFHYYCKDEAKVRAAIAANGGSYIKDNRAPLNPGSGPQDGATINQ